MWTKKAPERNGYYWVTQKNQLTEKEYTHPVRVYTSSSRSKKPDTVFSDGEYYDINDKIFIEWYSEQIPMPAQVVPGPKLKVTKRTIIERKS